MKFFIDTAEFEEIKAAYKLGFVDGVTTNPSSLCGDAEYAAADILRKADRYGCHAGCLFPAILAGGPGFNRTAFYEGVS